ncbi:aspartate kinase [Vaginella massiliensis]|uniref:aspartate kinase n=1 Tax=Vaginella massiliensis TaxID=1816680 RepID=UPI00083987D8|nr:aspartate kinase [Vaginella massiliensis]
MKVYKFGGASVKDADSVKNVAILLEKVGCEDTFMVVSAMGKTTNALEEVVQLYFDEQDYEKKIHEIEAFHLEIVKELFDDQTKINQELKIFFSDIVSFLRRNKSPNYSYVYDQVVCNGELASTRIISAYLNQTGIANTWLDVRDYLKTDNNYREGKVNWDETEKNFRTIESGKLYVTQGFLGSDENHFTTTLGREGSDYTAAIIAYCLDAQSMTIWKDVPGVLNADPRYFSDPVLLNHISYEEAIELAYYGASVIHPKTMQPLQNKEIPFFVKSFINPTDSGTAIKKGAPLEPKISCFILKKDQHLVRFSSKDFSFITEDKLSGIFNQLYDAKIKVNLMQNSAISLSLCVEDKYGNLKELLNKLDKMYNIQHDEQVNLYTIRHFDEHSEKVLPLERELLRQTLKETLQIVTKA